MAEIKSFRVPRSEKPNIPFQIELEQHDGTITTETFEANPKVPGAMILDFVAAGSLGSEYTAAAVRRFFSTALTDGDRERFFKTIDESDPAIDLSQLMEISNWLISQYGERPTSSATPS